MNENTSRFVRRLIISYSTLLLIVLIMGAYLYGISINNVSKEIRNQNKFILEKNIANLDAAFNNMDVLAGQIVTNTNIVRLSTGDYDTDNTYYLLAYHAQSSLSVYVYTTSILPINTYYIYLKNPDYILSANQFQDTHSYYKGTLKYYSDQYDTWIDSLNGTFSFRTFVSTKSLKTYDSPSYLYVLNLDNYSLKNVPATICFELDPDKLSDLFNDLSYYDSGYLYVTDTQGQSLFTINGSGNVDTDNDHTSLTNLDYSNDFANLDDMFVTHLSSSYNHWNYYLVQPASASLYSLENYRDIFIAIISVALLIELIMILFLSKTNLHKFRQLGTELQDTLSKQLTLQELVEKQRPLIRDSYLSKIMKGNISTEEELDYARQYLNIEANSYRFSVLYLLTYTDQYEYYVDHSAVTGPGQLNEEEIITNGISEFFADSHYLMPINSREYYLLLFYDKSQDTASLVSKTEDQFLQLHHHLMDNHSIWTFAGLGSWNDSLMVTWKSYQQATQVISYTTKRDVFRYYATTPRQSNGFYYPLELTQQLDKFITTGNESQVLEIFEIIRHENLEIRSLPLTMMNYLLSDIKNTLLKIRFTIPTNSNTSEGLLHVDSLFNEHMSLKLCEDLAIYLCRLFHFKPQGNKLIEAIKNYIDTNFQDPSLGLTKISEEFAISESYFSFLFKEEVGENFSTYLKHRRMEQAMTLLANSDINISDIYQEVGYNNSHTFRRAFKKIYGISPKDARLQARNV